MATTALTPENKVALIAIAKQRIDSIGDIFEYDEKKMRDYLNESGASEKYIITPDKQFKILLELSACHAIDMD